MKKQKKPYGLKAPFLKKISVQSDKVENWNEYPFSISLFNNKKFSIDIQNPVTIIVGDNGSGKSTLLEAIAGHCGFSLSGGSRNHTTHEFKQEDEKLSEFLRFAWLPKIGKGYFFRAETFLGFVNGLDDLSKDPMIGQLAFDGVGGKSLRERSHG